MYITYIFQKLPVKYCSKARRLVLDNLQLILCNRVNVQEPHSKKTESSQSSNIIIEPRHDKTNKMSERPAKTQISLGIRPVWSESSLCAQWVAKVPRFLHPDSEDWSDWADAQADLSLRWAHLFRWFCHAHTHSLIVRFFVAKCASTVRAYTEYFNCNLKLQLLQNLQWITILCKGIDTGIRKMCVYGCNCVP